MKRRNFLKTTTGTVILTASVPHFIPWLNFDQEGTDIRDFVLQMVKENDSLIPELLERQQKDSSHPYYGGIPDRYRMYAAGGAAGMIRRMTSSLISGDSKYYNSKELTDAMEKAAACLLKLQHEDGTIDLLTTNFHSTPDLAFVTEHICLAYGLLGRKKEKTGNILELLRTFLVKAGKALTTGGIHTPNHRWVICMALARIHSIFPDNSYIHRIDQWLGEGIDIDPDGQYTEKSAHVYSPLTDRCLITIARLLNRQELLEPVRRNLNMTLYYIHPNGEIATEASGRQDKYQIGTLQNYFYPYHYLSLEDNNRQYAAMSRFVRQVVPMRSLLGNLALFQEDEMLLNRLPQSTDLPENYIRIFKHSDLARIRRDEIDATILAKNPVFFTFSKNNAFLQGIRLATAFFGKGQFAGEYLEERDGSFVLEHCIQGPYYQPLLKEDISPDSKWTKVQREKRPHSEIQELNTQVTVREENKTFVLDIDISGTDNVPIALELVFRHEGILTGVTEIDDIENAYLLESGLGAYSCAGDTILFGPGRADHSWTQLRGALPRMKGMSVYVTGFTPFTYEMKIY